MAESSTNKKINQTNISKFPSELRQEPISEQWIVIATGRAKRPEMFKKEKKKRREASAQKCPFCRLSQDEKVLLVFNKGQEIKTKTIPKKWTTIVVPNKYPALLPLERLEEMKFGPFKRINGAGYHEVVITYDHNRSLAQLSIEEIKEVLEAYQKRYLELADEKFVDYVNIFHNHGPSAGASIAHPHSQIITTPVSAPEFQLVLRKLKNYYQRKKKCFYCEILDWERKDGRRIIFENKDFLVLCPYASRVSFEVRIYPKKHKPYFEEIKEKEKYYLAEAFKVVLSKLYKGLNDPDYNFYLHTAPCDEKKHDYYHWHFVFWPKTSILAGFELGAKIHVSTIEPEKAAEYLKKIK